MRHNARSVADSVVAVAIYRRGRHTQRGPFDLIIRSKIPCPHSLTSLWRNQINCFLCRLFIFASREGGWVGAWYLAVTFHRNHVSLVWRCRLGSSTFRRIPSHRLAAGQKEKKKLACEIMIGPFFSLSAQSCCSFPFIVLHLFSLALSKAITGGWATCWEQIKSSARRSAAAERGDERESRLKGIEVRSLTPV